MRTDPSLPDGYHVEEAEGRLRLRDARGTLLLEEPLGPDAASVMEEEAWRDAWYEIGLELQAELADLRAGVRPLRMLRRVRQHMRLVDAAAQAARAAEERPRRMGVMPWVAIGASAAAVAAAVLLVVPLRTARIPAGVSPPSSSQRVAAPSAVPRAPVAAPAERSAGAPGNLRGGSPARAAEAPRGQARAARSAPRRRVLAGYAVSFGQFASRGTADSMMHLIRSKGYVVYIAPAGEWSQVVTRPFRTRAQAERLVTALQEIGLPAQLATARAL